MHELGACAVASRNLLFQRGALHNSASWVVSWMPLQQGLACPDSDYFCRSGLLRIGLGLKICNETWTVVSSQHAIYSRAFEYAKAARSCVLSDSGALKTASRIYHTVAYTSTLDTQEPSEVGT